LTEIDDDDVPTYPSEFHAWRGWSVEKGLLRSINDGQIWVPGEPFEAECGQGRQHKRIPWPSCTCGLYSVKTFAKLQANKYHTMGAFGKVAIWGEILESTEGYKSQFAYPLVIYVAHLDHRKVNALRERYQVMVKMANPYKMTEPKEDE
jgi:hypothetical protein